MDQPPMMLAYLLTGGESVRLVRVPGGLEWQATDNDLLELVDRVVPIRNIPESGGNPAAWAIRELEKYLPGETCVLASNVSPVEKDYGRYYP